MAVSAGLNADNQAGCKMFFSGFSPFEGAISQYANEHRNCSEFVLELFGKSYANVLLLIGDNYSTNQAFSKMGDIPLVGFSSHRFS